MQKKIFTSLLVSPLALSAFANIPVADLNNADWKSGSVTGGTLVQDDGSIKGGLGVGTITQTVNVPCPGNYEVKFISGTNLKLSVSGAVVTEQEDNGNGTITFTASGKGAVTISAKSANAAEAFTFASSDLKIVFDFKEAQDALSDALKEVSNIAEVTEITDKEDPCYALAQTLTADRLKFIDAQDEDTGIPAEIAKIVASTDTDLAVAAAADLKTYEDNKLYEDPNPIMVKINALKANSDALNAKIVNFNTNYKALYNDTEDDDNPLGLYPELDNLETALAAQSDRLAATAVSKYIADNKLGLSAADVTAAAEFVDGECGTDNTNLAADIAAYKAEIAAAYADLTAEVDFEPTKSATDLSDAIDALKTKIDGAYGGVDAYAKVYGTVANGAEQNGYVAALAAEVTAAKNEILAITSANPDQPGVYTQKQADWIKAINEANSTASAVFAETTWANAGDTEVDANNSKAASDATTALNGVVTEATTLSTAQNAAWEAADEAYQELLTAYNEAAMEAEVTAIDLPAEKRAEYDKLLAPAKAAVANVLSTIKSEYAKLDLSKEDYEDLISEATSTTADAEGPITLLKTFTDGLGAQLEAQKELQAFKTYLKTAQETLSLGSISVDLESKFANNISSLQAAVNAVTDATLDGVKEAISDNQTYAEKLVDALQTAHDASTEVSKSIDWLKTSCTVTTLVDGKTANDGYQDVQDAITDLTTNDTAWKAEYSRVVAIADPEECWSAATTLGEDITEANWQDAVTTAFNAYIKGITTDNCDAANLALEQIKNILGDDNEIITDEDGAYETAKDELVEVKEAAIAAAAMPTTSQTEMEAKLTAANKVNTDIQALWKNTVKDLYDNVVAYDDLDSKIQAQLGEALTALNTEIDKYKDSAAYTYYQSLSSDLKDALDAKETALKALLPNQVVEHKTEFEDAIKTLAAQNGATGSIVKITIPANEAAHNEELEAASGALETIITVLSKIQEKEGASDLATTWINQLVNLRDKDLKAANDAVDAAYAKGECDAKNLDLLAQYTKITNAANDVLKEFSGEDGWLAFVIEHNNALLDSDAWKTAKSTMNTTYVDAINAFNGYVGLNIVYTSCNAFQEVATNNAELFNMSSNSRKLINAVSLAVTKANTDGTALTEDAFKEIALDPADEIITNMQQAAAKMIGDFNDAGEEFYTTGYNVTTGKDTADEKTESYSGYKKQADDALEAAANLLAAEPYKYEEPEIKEILAGYQKQNDDATEAYTKASDLTNEWNATETKDGVTVFVTPGELLANYKKTVGYAMGAIADELEQVINYNLNTEIIEKVWNPTYKEYVDGNKAEGDDAILGFTALATELAKYSEINAISEIYTAQKTIFDTNKSNAESLNTNIGTFGNLLTETDGKSLIDSKIEALEGYYAAAKAAVDKVVAAYDANQTVIGFDDALSADNTSIAALKQIVTLGGAASVDITAAEDAVKAFEAKLGSYKAGGDNAPTADDVETLKEAADTAIASALSAAKTAESDYLYNYLNPLKVAYNDAYAKDSSVQATYLAQVDAWIEGQENLDTEETTAADFYAAAKALEDQISDLIVNLQKVTTPAGEEAPALKSALDTLNGAYDLMEGKVNAAKTELDTADDMVKDEYSEEYDDLLTELADIKTEYEGLGNSVIAKQGVYEAQIAAIESKINDIKADVATASANATEYNSLYKTVYEPAKEKAEALSTLAGEYDVNTEYGTQIMDANSQVAAILEEIQALYDERKLTETDVETPTNTAVMTFMDGIDLQMRKSYGNAQSDVADSKLKEVLAWLNSLGKDVQLLPGTAGEQTSVQDKYDTLLNTWKLTNKDLNAFDYTKYVGATATDPNNNYEAGVKEIEDIIAKYIGNEEDEIPGIINEAEALLQSAQESSYMLGDLNGNGEVNISDAQMMLGLISDGVTFEELLKENRQEAYAANIIGDDKINIADFSALINLINKQLEAPATRGSEVSPIELAFARLQSIESEGSINVVAVSEENGIRTYAVSIDAPESFVGGQIDFRVASTSRIVSVRGTERIEDHTLVSKDNSETTRVVIASFENEQFKGHQGVTLYIDVEGHSGLGFENALFTDEDALSYTFKDKAMGTSGIDSIIEGTKAVKEAIYDAAGRALDKIRRGVNIIRHSDGSVTKEIRK